MERRVAIVGAGVAGLVACKYTLSKGYKPVVFESSNNLGGVWQKTVETTKLQSAKSFYQFSDFPWPESVVTNFPDKDQVFQYIESYAKHFDLIRHITFNSKVINIAYEGVDEDEIKAWSMWSANCEALNHKGKWNITVENTLTHSSEVYQADFVILALGRFSDVPHLPKFPPKKGPEVFQGEVIHAKDYVDMDYEEARNFVKGKRVTVVGFRKFAVDIANECAAINGKERPCTMIYRRGHWFMCEAPMWGFILGHFYFSRFGELLVHNPGQGSLRNVLSTALSPLRWSMSKLAESFLKWKLPFEKYGLVPEHRFSTGVSACKILNAPEGFFDKAEEGSIKFKKAEEFSFCKEGILVKGEAEPIETDLVIFATGYNGEKKVPDIFVSQFFQELMTGPNSTIPNLYRQCIHPRIPQLAVIGLSESLSNLFTSEIISKWVSELLVGSFKLPSISDMEIDIREIDVYMKRQAGEHYGKSCLPAIHIWYNDRLCKDMGLTPKRKEGFLAELFEPYGPLDYTSILN
ncbi:unnamed protein product [Rhodiola kirilowii]